MSPGVSNKVHAGARHCSNLSGNFTTLKHVRQGGIKSTPLPLEFDGSERLSAIQGQLTTKLIWVHGRMEEISWRHAIDRISLLSLNPKQFFGTGLIQHLSV